MEQKNRPLLIVTRDLESDLLAVLIINKRHVGLKVCAIKSSGFGDNRRANLDDLAVLSGGEVRKFLIHNYVCLLFMYSQGNIEHGLSLNDVQQKKLLFLFDDTIILYRGGNKKQIEEGCEEFSSTIENTAQRHLLDHLFQFRFQH
ncbi:hypothetical protein LXL04_009638 [Taraxacum kok-saghyz]